jgi:sarcosine/dimethylglycine N-methyltransferase
MNAEQGLEDKVDVVDGSFEQVPYDDATFDVVWSQDAILHSGDRDKVVAEAARVLKPGGHLIFTDICEVEGVDKEKLQPIYDRIHLSSLGSRKFYEEAAKKYGLELVEIDMHTEHLITHYGRVLRETESREQEIGQVVSQDYIERMKKGLQHWVNGGKNGHIEWGIFHFRKPA